MAKTGLALVRELAKIERYAELVLAGVEQAGFVELPQSRLRIEEPGDRLLVLQFLSDIGRGRVDPRQWAMMNPEKFARLAEIFPRTEEEE